MVRPVWCWAFWLLPCPSRLGPVIGCGGGWVLRVSKPVLPCCGPLVSVVGRCFACSGGVSGWCSLLRPVRAFRPLSWGLVAACPLRSWSPWPPPPPPFFFQGLPLVLVALFCSLAGALCSVRSPVVVVKPFVTHVRPKSNIPLIWADCTLQRRPIVPPPQPPNLGSGERSLSYSAPSKHPCNHLTKHVLRVSHAMSRAHAS